MASATSDGRLNANSALFADGMIVVPFRVITNIDSIRYGGGALQFEAHPPPRASFMWGIELRCDTIRAADFRTASTSRRIALGGGTVCPDDASLCGGGIGEALAASGILAPPAASISTSAVCAPIPLTALQILFAPGHGCYGANPDLLRSIIHPAWQWRCRARRQEDVERK
jgi:hypothetical protein